MDTSRIPLDVQAGIGPRGFDDLASVLVELGYEPRHTGTQSGGSPGPGGDDAGMALTTGQPIAPEAATVLLEAVSNWIRQRPVRRGRFRRRRPRPVTVTIHGPAGEVLRRGTVDRG